MRKGYHYNLNPTFKNVFSPKNLGMINTTTNCKYYVLMGHIILLNDSRPTAKFITSIYIYYQLSFPKIKLNTHVFSDDLISWSDSRKE